MRLFAILLGTLYYVYLVFGPRFLNEDWIYYANWGVALIPAILTLTCIIGISTAYSVVAQQVVQKTERGDVAAAIENVAKLLQKGVEEMRKAREASQRQMDGIFRVLRIEEAKEAKGNRAPQKPNGGVVPTEPAPVYNPQELM